MMVIITVILLMRGSQFIKAPRLPGVTAESQRAFLKRTPERLPTTPERAAPTPESQGGEAPPVWRHSPVSDDVWDDAGHATRDCAPFGWRASPREEVLYPAPRRARPTPEGILSRGVPRYVTV